MSIVFTTFDEESEQFIDCIYEEEHNDVKVLVSNGQAVIQNRFYLTEEDLDELLDFILDIRISE